jgi:serine/threonine-protein kinase/endoribonuclease IRE1
MYQVCFEDDFRIGEGSNGTEVFLGLSTDGLEAAIKRLPMKFENNKFAENEKALLNSPKLVESPHVLNYRFYFQNKQYAYIVTDLQEENLKQFVHSKKVDKLQNEGPTILREILSGVGALHADNILHRDLKPENVLVNFEGTMVLADFGICRRLQPDQTTHESVIRGTDKWRALESIPTDDDYNQQSPYHSVKVRYKKESDVQTLGMIFFYILTQGNHPFGTWNFDVLSNIKRGKSNLAELTDLIAKDLIEWMLQYNLTLRPTVEQCRKHPYFTYPGEKFELLKAVETEIKTEKENRKKENRKMENNNSEVGIVGELNQLPPWSKQIDDKLYNHFTRPHNRYSDNGAELLRFIRNASEHWPAPFLQTLGTPQAYFLKVFPKLPMIVHKIVRKYPDWCRRETLKRFFY